MSTANHNLDAELHQSFDRLMEDRHEYTALLSVEKLKLEKEAQPASYNDLVLYCQYIWSNLMLHLDEYATTRVAGDGKVPGRLLKVAVLVSLKQVIKLVEEKKLLKGKIVG
ncbi:uncharacterized protein JCM15063_006118 [Sporobolomyces koalae]|uniref:uncharacterized protein n=1 Tax=Sporobolomyces koalae TaxID=500713 RepID=UPI0031741E6F